MTARRAARVKQKLTVDDKGRVNTELSEAKKQYKDLNPSQTDQ